MLKRRPSGLRVPRAQNLALRLLVLLLLPAVFLLVRPLAAQTGDPCEDRTGCGPIRSGTTAGNSRVICFTPATPAPASIWGLGGAQLQPADTGTTLPPERDSTSFNELNQAYSSKNWFYGVDIKNGYILMGLAHGIGIWDARTDPANPALVVAQRYGVSGAGGFPFIPTGESSKIVFGGISAADDTVAALAGYSGSGILVFDLTDKTKPRPVYQNKDKTSESVYATKIGSTRYAFLASTSGLFVYNLDRAVAANGCLEDSTNTGQGCPGVFVGALPTPTGNAAFVHGDGNYVAAGFGSSSGLRIYDVSNPASPVVKLDALHSSGARPVQGVALWHQGSSYYLAARVGATITQNVKETAIYDVTCITSANGCSGLGAPLNQSSPLRVLDTQSGSEYLTFSRSGSTAFLYVGGDASCVGSDDKQHEWLLDVSNPAAPADITPTGSIQASAIYSGVSLTKPVGYWNWYYRASPKGFNLVTPRAGMFLGDYFYRAGRSIFDIHKRTTSSPPAADFSWSPTEIYPGTAVTFTDRSTGAPTQWAWTFQDGTPSLAATSSPQVTFGSPGTKLVTDSATNGIGTGATTKSVVVLNPTPAGSVTASADVVTVCQAVTFTANATGAPTLTYNWEVLDPNSANVAIPASTGTAFTWTSPSTLAPGLYTGKVTVKNSFSPGGVPLTKTIQVNALPALTDISALPPTTDVFTNNAVHFHAPTLQGATQWIWTWGDGKTDTYTDPVQGASPTHTYADKGTYAATVKISNCVNQTGFTSLPVSVIVTQTTPLTAHFQAALTCQFGQCFGGIVNTPIAFVDSSTGADKYDYDWSHTGTSAATCSFTDNDHGTAVATHTYTAAGNYSPCLRVRRGTSEQDVFVHGPINVATTDGGGGGSASISVGGASSGQINQSYTFTASASNCTPSSTGYTWNTGGGTGTSTNSTISITWTTAGTKTVSVSNTGCSGASGSKSVSITDSTGGGGGTLQAVFGFLPAAPKPGDVVSFNGGASTGSPTGYNWNFGDGTTGSGATATHAYANAGTYSVQLAVSKPSTGCPFAPCVAESKATQVVVVQGTPPPPPISADFTANVDCINVGGFDQCQATTAKTVTLTAAATDATTYTWSFGDGATGTGPSVTHAWAKPDTYPVTLTVTKGTSNATKTRTFIVSGVPVPSVKSVVLPWIAQTRGVLVQSSDLYVHNPSANPMTVTLEFRKRGLPESNPPRVDKTLAAGATLYVADVLRELFNRENIAGYVSLVVKQGDVEPIITSYNTTVQSDGKQYGQTVGGVSTSSSGSAVGTDPTSQRQNLVGLVNDAERLTYFGVSNPNAGPTTYHLRFYDKDGKQIGESSQDLTVSSFGQRQFQAAEIQSLFGISNETDYRVEIETKSGGTLVPYASNLRLASDDPSFIAAGSSKNAKSYLLGVLSAPGLNNSTWQSDLLLSNTGTQTATADVTFTALGVAANPTSPLHVTLQPGETQRLENVVASQWGIHNGIGVLTVKSTSPNGIFPVVQGESYDNTNPTNRFGQAMSAITDDDAAGANQVHTMVGLRQDSGHRTTLWLFNPGTTQAQYDIVYRALDGSVLGTTAGVLLGGGKLKQISPSQHPLPAAGVANGFTVQVVVKSGKVLSAAQVVNNATNDPAYIQGEVR